MFEAQIRGIFERRASNRSKCEIWQVTTGYTSFFSFLLWPGYHLPDCLTAFLPPVAVVAPTFQASPRKPQVPQLCHSSAAAVDNIKVCTFWATHSVLHGRILGVNPTILSLSETFAKPADHIPEKKRVEGRVGSTLQNSREVKSPISPHLEAQPSESGGRGVPIKSVSQQSPRWSLVQPGALPSPSPRNPAGTVITHRRPTPH